MNKGLITTLLLFASISLFGESGVASWYGPTFHGKLTANGERFNTYDFTAAHKTLPFNTVVRVTSLTNNRSVVVRINDRGPFVHNRIIDLSEAAAREIDMIKTGTDNVTLEIILNGENNYHRYHSNSYSIQVGAFSNRANAEAMQNRLTQANISASITEVTQQTVIFRVIVSGLNYSEMQLTRVTLARIGITNFVVRRS